MFGKSRPAPSVAKATRFVAPDLTEGRLRAQAAILLRREEHLQVKRNHRAAVAAKMEAMKKEAIKGGVNA